MSWGKGLPGGDWEIGGNFEVSLDTSKFCDLLKLPQFTYIKTFTEADFLNLFHATGLFLYPLKLSENQRFLDVFMGV